MSPKVFLWYGLERRVVILRHRDLKHNAQAQVTGTPTVTKFEEADLIFEIQQSLLNNSFGATRSEEAEARWLSSPAVLVLDLGQWMVSTAEIYYNAFLPKEGVEASRHTLEIQKRLLKITKILKIV